MPASQADSSKVLMIVRDGSRDQELMLREEALKMKEIVEQAGYEVEVATVHDETLVGESVSISPDLTIDSIEMSRYKGLLLPCMAAPPGDTMPARIVDIIGQALELDLPVAGARASVREIARAGGLSGKKYSFAMQTDVEKFPEFTNGTFVGTGVTLDGKISTSGICPLAAKALNEIDGTTQLAESFISSLQSL